MRQKLPPALPKIVVLLLLSAWLALAVSDSAFISQAPIVSNRHPAGTSEASAIERAPSVKLRYRASAAVIPNPERGFYYMADCDRPLEPAQLNAWRMEEAHTLAVCSVNLGPFMDSRIDRQTLALFDRNMATMRTAGMKAILRFSYSSDIAGKDASLAWIETHLEQLKPHLERNKDVIAVMHAGFIGGWGEWAYSQHFGNLGKLDDRNWRDRKAVVEKLLQAVPAERMVQLRIPDFKRRFVGARPLDPSEAFNRSPRARLAHHNDCFLASENDWGTYTNRSAEYPYLEAETKFVAMGGETCNYAPERSNCATALTELPRFHYSYLNASYHADVLRAWKEQGCFREIRQKLGYRFVLERGSYPVHALPGNALPISLTLSNQGWAAPYNSRDVELVLRNKSSRVLHRFKLDTDPRLWLPGQALHVRQAVRLPSDFPEGMYEMLLNLPDPAPALRNWPVYAIQLANENAWERDTGFNRLNHVIEVKRLPSRSE